MDCTCGGRRHRQRQSGQEHWERHGQMVALFKPTWGCFLGGKSFLFSGSGTQRLRLLTDMYPLAERLLPMLRRLAEAYLPSCAVDGADMHRNAKSLTESAAKMASEDAAERTGKSLASVQGPEGVISPSLKKSIKGAVVAFSKPMKRLKEEGVPARVTDKIMAKALLTLNVETSFTQYRNGGGGNTSQRSRCAPSASTATDCRP